MSSTELPDLVDFSTLKTMLDAERKAVLKAHAFGDSDEYVRDLEGAAVILDFVEKIQTHLWQFFKDYPSLISLFTSEFTSFHQFMQRDNVLDLCFLDDCLFPEKEIYFFGQDGGISLNILEIHLKAMQKWTEDKRDKHNLAQKRIIEEFDLNLKPDDLSCACHICENSLRNRLRDFVFEDCKQVIDERVIEIEQSLTKESLDAISEHYKKLQKEIDKKFYKIRFRLRRSTLNRLESQVKSYMRDLFTYPSKLARAQVENIRPVLKGHLFNEGLPDDLLTDEEFTRFYRQLASNIWKNERYILTEFAKTMRSVLVLKKKDMSSKILTEYLGEFWTHSNARQIKRKIIYHKGPTNSGKTYHAIEALSKAQRGCYLAPLRLLAGELYDTLNQKGVVTTLLTGEEVIEVEGATHTSSTIEMARFNEIFDCAVIDEIQMLSDPQRGWAWTRALVNIFAPEVHVCGDASVLDLVQAICDLCGDTLEVKEYTRMTELQVMPNTLVLADLERSDALIVFSRKNALRFKRDLEKLGFRVSIVYGRLSPEVRREQARKFDGQETDIIVSTDAIAMGMNLPIKRIVFSTLTKFFNSQEYIISDSEIKQIAGRAGRFQRFPTGYVTCLNKVEDGLQTIQDALNATLDQNEKCMVGPDLDIFNQVNTALTSNGLPGLKLSEFLRLFNTMTFISPFHCVELNEMIELAEMVEDADPKGKLSYAEIFGFACAPVNQGLVEHVQYFVWILSHYVADMPIRNEDIDFKSNDIDYLETKIKCVELFQWLSRHFNRKNFDYDDTQLLENKNMAIEKLNTLLSDKIVPTCSSCGCKLPENTRFAICETCFQKRRFSRRGPPGGAGASGSGDKKSGPGKKFGKPFGKPGSGDKKRSRKRKFSGGKK